MSTGSVDNPHNPETGEVLPAVVEAESNVPTLAPRKTLADLTARQKASAVQEACAAINEVVQQAGMAVHMGKNESGEDRYHWTVEAWLFTAATLGCTTEIVRTERAESLDGKLGYIATAVVIDSNGQEIARAQGSDFRGQGRRNKDYELMGMASTRATSRACRQAFGYVASMTNYSPTPVSEMPDGDEAEDRVPVWQARWRQALAMHEGDKDATVAAMRNAFPNLPGAKELGNLSQSEWEGFVSGELAVSFETDEKAEAPDLMSAEGGTSPIPPPEAAEQHAADEMATEAVEGTRAEREDGYVPDEPRTHAEMLDLLEHLGLGADAEGMEVDGVLNAALEAINVASKEGKVDGSTNTFQVYAPRTVKRIVEAARALTTQGSLE